ncbi:tetratricopeptide repeat protein [Dactylosporangium sp. CS-033363]|uniref:tetratricopeptide repeat protein n=1 Tax=Dactylosporangium sp. CS-033363 TaxID=3239935 RepID=UPI003D908CE4
MSAPSPGAGELPLVVPILVALGRTLGRHGRHREASDALRRALAEPEEKPVGDVLLALVDALLAAGERDEALRVVLEHGRTSPGAVVRALPRLTRHLRPAVLRPAVELLEHADWAAVVADPGTPAPTRRALLAFLVRARLALNEPAAATALLDAAGGLAEDDQELLVLRSDGLLGGRDLDGALSALMAADGLPGPLAAGIRLRLAGLYEQLGRAEEALAQLDAAEAAGDRSENPPALRALVLLQRYDLDGARAAFEAARRLGPDSVATTRAGACVHLAAHDYQAATETADAGLTRHPGHSGLSFLRFQALVERAEDTADIERRLAQFLHRMPAATLQEYAERAARIRPADDPAVHYFLAALGQARGRPAEALRGIDTALALLTEPAPAEPDPLELPARRLRAQVLEPLLPAEAAAEYERAGLLAYTVNQLEAAAQLLGAAEGLGELSQVGRWELADALQLNCSVPAAPMTIDRQQLDRAREVWDEAWRREMPEVPEAWPYIIRARIAMHYARIDAEPRSRIAEAAVWLQCYDALNESTEDSINLFSSITALFGLYGLSRDVVWSIARGPKGDRYVPDGNRLATAGANAGDLDLVAEGITRIDPEAEPGVYHNTRSRLEILRGDGPAAVAALDAEPEEHRNEFSVWRRALAEGLAGDRDAAAATLAAGDAAAAWEGIAVWLRLLGGEPQQALQILAGLGDEQSWSMNAAFERALCRLADGPGDDAEAEALAVGWARTCRSFEDVGHLPVLARMLAWRYPHAAPAFDRIAAAGRDRLAEGLWPLTAEDDLAHLEALAGAESEGWLGVAGRAFRARLAMARGAWDDAIAAYRALIGDLDRFPEVESGLAWVLTEVRAGAADPAAAVDAIEDAVGELRRHDSRRAGDFLIELTLGDAHRQGGRVERAEGQYRIVADRPGPPRHLALAAVRLHLLAVERGDPGAEVWLGRALEAFGADSEGPYFDVAGELSTLIPTAEAWRPVLAAWGPEPGETETAGGTQPGDTAQAPRAGDTAGERALLHMAGRFYLAFQLAAEGRAAEAEPEYRAVLETGRPVLGAEEPSMLTTWQNLATTIADQGRAEEAAAEFRALLPVQRRVLGEDAQLTLDCWTRLTQQLALAGRWDEAEAELPGLVAACRRTGGDEAAGTLMARFEQAWVWYNLGRHAEAEEEYQAVAEGRARTFAPDDAGTLVARAERCLTLVALGRLDEAAAELREVLDARIRTEGPDHGVTLAVRKQLGDVLIDLGDGEGAEEQFGALAEARERLFGAQDPATLLARRDLAVAVAAGERWEEAGAALRALLGPFRALYGDDDPETVFTWTGVINMLFNAGHQEEAEAELAEIIRVHAELHGEDGESVAALREWGDELLAEAHEAKLAVVREYET